jgi:hypothetical protein
MFPIEPNFNGWEGEAFFSAVRRTRERAMQIDPAGHFKSSCERMMRGESQPVEVRGLYHNGFWIDECKDFNLHHVELMLHGVTPVTYVSADEARHIPWRHLIGPRTKNVVRHYVCSALQTTVPELDKFDSDYVREA